MRRRLNMADGAGRRLFCGIEGGGTASDAVIVNADGRVVAESRGGCTNPWAVGFDGAVETIHSMVSEAKKKAGVPESHLLESLGMCLSGGEQTQAQERIISQLKERYPNTTRHYLVRTDTFGSIATAFPKGGMVLISGTGSNCQVLNPSGDSPRCGGWGHMLGDEGSGYSIAHKAIKIVYDAEDGMADPPHEYDIALVKKAVYQYFNMTNRFDILNYIYEDFKKCHIAGLCKTLADLAVSTKDPLCCHIFHQAGADLARHVKALIPKADKSLLEQKGGIHIVAVGSVLTKAWDLLKDGFVEVLRETDVSVTMVKLKVSSAIGALLLGAESAGLALPVDYSTHSTLMYEYDKC